MWYLATYCHRRKAIRIFAPTRILKMEVTKEKFERPNAFDPSEFFRTAFSIVADHEVGDVALRFAPVVAPIIRERRWHATQKVEDLPGGEVRLTMTCSQGDELKAWLLSWGEDLDIEAPSELVNKVAASHRRAADRSAAIGSETKKGRTK